MSSAKKEPGLSKFIPLIICLIAIFVFTVNYACATNSSSGSGNLNSDIQNSSGGVAHTYQSQSSSGGTSNFNITNNFHEVNKTNYTNPGKVVNQSNYCNWVWTVINITNKGPDDGTITIKDLGSNGFVYYNPQIKWNGWVLYNNGTGWIWDKNFNVTTGMGTYFVPSGASYQVAILGYINGTGSKISNSVSEVSQDNNGPAVYPSVTSTIYVPPAAIIKVYQEFRKTYNGSPLYNADINDYVYSVTRTVNNGPDTANVIYKTTFSGFKYKGSYAVSKDNGVTWTFNDGSFSSVNNQWTIKIPSNATYLLALYGQVTKSGTVTANMTEISQDVYNPYGPDNTKPKCVIVFDDGNVAQYTTAYNYMKTKGILGTVYINGYDIGNSGVLTLPELVEMYMAGWVIANHTFDHSVLTNLTSEQAYNEILNQINYLLSNGFTNGAYHLAYPGGNLNQQVMDIMKSLGIETGRTTQGMYIDNLNAQNLYELPAFTILNTTSVSTIKSYIDTAIYNDSTVVLLFHNLKNSNPGTYEYLTSDFYSVIDYIASSGIDCLTIDDLYQLSAQPVNLPSNISSSSSSNGSNGYAGDFGSIYVNPTGTIGTDVGVTISTSNSKPNYHDNVTLTITVTNNGPNQALDVTVGEWLDGNYLKWISDDSNGAYDPNTSIWTVGTIDNGDSYVLNIVAQIIASNVTINNSATYNSGSTPDLDLSNNYQSVSLVVPEVGVPTATKLAVQQINGYKGDSKYLTAQLTDAQNNPIVGKTVNFTVNGISAGSAVTDTNGTASLQYILNYTSGIYTIMAMFLQDANFGPSTGTSTLNILATPTAIIINPITGYNGDKVNIISKLTDTHSNIPLSGKTINYYINGNIIGTANTDSTGTATYLYTITQNAGTYIIQALYNGDTTYAAANNTNNLTVNLTPTSITVNPITGNKGDKVNIISKLTDTHSNIPLSGKTINYYINGNIIGTANTDSTGTATYMYTITQNAGTYIIQALYNGDTPYAAANNTNNLIVNSLPTNISVNPLTGYKGDKVNLTATIKDNAGNMLNGKVINFYVNGASVGSGTSNTSGVASYIYTISQNAGTYIIQALFNGDTTYAAANSTNNLTVNLTPTSITTTSKTGYYGDKISITATLKDTHSNIPISGKTIQFLVNGTNVGTAVTNSNGIATLNYTITQGTGTYSIVTQFLSDASYYKSSASGVLTVNPTLTSIAMNPITTRKGYQVKLAATLSETHKNTLLAGKKVYFYVNNKLVGTGITNKYGVASFIYVVTLNTGKYSLIAKFVSDSIYTGTSKSTTITVQ